MEPACLQCGGPARSACGKCRIARYCSPDCQTRDWKHHKPQCKQCTTMEHRAVFVMITLDLDKILDNWSIYEPMGPFFTQIFLIDQRAGSTVLLPIAVVLSSDLGIKTIHRGVDTTLELLCNQMGKSFDAVSKLFRHNRYSDDNDVFSVEIPRGVPQASHIFSEQFADVLRTSSSNPSVAPGREAWDDLMKRLEHASKVLCEAYPEGIPGPNEDSPTSFLERAVEQVNMYDGPDYLEGSTEMSPYPASILPMGSLVTVLHFVHGAFFKRVDFTTCRKGLAVDRLMAFHPSPMIIDCRKLRKMKDAIEQGEMNVDPRGVCFSMMGTVGDLHGESQKLLDHLTRRRRQH